MRNLLIGFLLGTTLSAAALPLVEQEVYIRWTRFRYNLNDRMTALLRAQLRLENGRKGSEAGLNPHAPKSYTDKCDPQAYSDPTAPDGSEQHCRLARRLLRETQRQVFLTEWDFKRFLLRYSTGYIGKGKGPGDARGKEAGKEYYRLLYKLYKEERKKMRAGYDPIRPSD